MNTDVTRTIAFWLPMTVIGFINGTFRTLILSNYFSEASARQISSLLLVMLLFIYTAFIFNKLQVRTAVDAWLTGVLWVFLTVAFEFGLGYVTGVSMEIMLAEYNVAAGKLWPLVLVALATLPLIHLKRQGSRKEREAGISRNAETHY